MARKEEHLKHETEIKSLMIDAVRESALTEGRTTPAGSRNQGLGTVMWKVRDAVTRADRTVRVTELEMALAEKTRLHREELQQERRACNQEKANLLIELRTACQYIFRLAAVAQQAGAAAPPFYRQLQHFVDANAINPQRLLLLQPAPVVPAAAPAPAVTDDDGGNVEDEP